MTIWGIWRSAVAVLLMFALYGVATAQESLGVLPPEPVHMRVYEADSSAYPEIKAYFSVLNRQNGRVLHITENSIQAALDDGTSKPITIAVQSLESQPNTARKLNLVLCFDLTASNTSDFLQQQKKTAFELIDNLAVNDAVTIVAQSHDGASVLFPLKADHGGARNVIDMLEIMPGDSNRFYDGVSMAVNVLSSVKDNTRSAVVVMTDVQNPEGTALPAQTIQLANTLNTPLYMIGYNDANRAVLDEFANATNGFTYLQREMDDNFDRLTRDMSDFLNHEYVLTLESPLPARDTAYELRLTVDVNGETFYSSLLDVKGTARPLIVTFPRIAEGQTFTDGIRFEPQITYADGGQPRGLRASYTLESSPTGRDVAPLNAVGTSDLTLAWNLKGKPGGEYAVKIHVEDDYGNWGEQVVHFVVASPLLAQFVDPNSPDTPITATTYASSSTLNRLLMRVEGSYSLSTIVLRLNENELGVPTLIAQAEATTDPNTAVASDGALLYEYAWDASQLAPGAYTVTVEAEDIRGNKASQMLQLDILLSSEDPFNILVFVVLLIVLVIILTALTLVRRATQKPLPPAPRATSNKRPRAVLDVVANGLPGRKEYLLMEKNYIVGRGDNSDIQVIGLAASRTHAELQWDGTGFTWIELTPEKKNPALINGYAVNRKHVLQDGDHIQLGDTVLRFRISSL